MHLNLLPVTWISSATYVCTTRTLKNTEVLKFRFQSSFIHLDSREEKLFEAVIEIDNELVLVQVKPTADIFHKHSKSILRDSRNSVQEHIHWESDGFSKGISVIFPVPILLKRKITVFASLVSSSKAKRKDIDSSFRGQWTFYL